MAKLDSKEGEELAKSTLNFLNSSTIFKCLNRAIISYYEAFNEYEIEINVLK